MTDMPRLRTWTALLLLGFCACASAPPPHRPAVVDRSPAKEANGAAATEANAGAEAMRSWAAGQGAYFKRAWGVDVVGVRLVASDWMLEFKFRVIDATKAAPLLDEHTTPYLVDDASGARLAVPAMENVGELRQHTTPDPNRIYFMIFGNANKIVPRGGRVSVVMGKFEATGLPVQ
ncbi:MAG: putative transrane protein [Gammaproteobacteria bacterium]|nr:putative transrane protein [Gammaproteobacteria bacterium]